MNSEIEWVTRVWDRMTGETWDPDDPDAATLDFAGEDPADGLERPHRPMRTVYLPGDAPAGAVRVR